MHGREHARKRNQATLDPRRERNTALRRSGSWAGGRETRGWPDRRREVLLRWKFHQTKGPWPAFHLFYGRRTRYRVPNLCRHLPF